MKERPILFSGPMVRAILEGCKTQTRRVVKPEWSRCLDLDDPDDRQIAIDDCPYGKPGDRLWVREAFRVAPETHEPDDHVWATYVADGAAFEIDCAEVYMGRITPGKSYPSIHMPRWASRILLEVTHVHVEQVQEIREPDALAEGVGAKHIELAVRTLDTLPASPYVGAFAALWDSINARRGYGWDANPWVWVVSFRMIDGGQQA